MLRNKIFNMLKKLRVKKKSLSSEIIKTFSKKFGVPESSVNLLNYKTVSHRDHASFAGQISYAIELDGELHIGRYFSGGICTDKIADKNYSEIKLPGDAL